jgi:UDP-2,3-diacylglucosamine hydrolase
MAELPAPPSWRTVDFISDLHLQASDRATFTAWQHYLESTPADAVFILGDLFEVWVGDDAIGEDLHARPPALTRAARRRWANAAGRLALFFMHGNRDFLVGQGLMDLCNATLLQDPTVLVFPAGSGRRWLLSHGDALCLGDTDYMAISQPGAHRRMAARLPRQAAGRAPGDRARAARAKRSAQKSGVQYADVDTDAARQWLQAATPAHADPRPHAQAGRARPGRRLSRVVLSDWDLAAPVPRAEVLRLTAAGLQRIAPVLF